MFELDNTAAHRFIWPYLFGYGGVLLLRTRTLHNSRARALVHAGRLEHYVAEFTFDAGHPPYLAHGTDYIRSDDWPMLRAPVIASRVTVATHPGVAQALQDEYPHARAFDARGAGASRQPSSRASTTGAQFSPEEVVFGVLTNDRVEVARRAFPHAQEGRLSASLLIDDAEAVMERADVILTLHWPGFGTAQTLALAAMGSGKPVVVLETEASADWPMLDPQTWRAWGVGFTPPVGVSVDLRDEEHSLGLAIRRLASDEALRSRLGEAGRAWWRIMPASMLQRTPGGGCSARPHPLIGRPGAAHWPAHLDVDGLERAREILGEFGVSADMLPRGPEVKGLATLCNLR